MQGSRRFTATAAAAGLLTLASMAPAQAQSRAEVDELLEQWNPVDDSITRYATDVTRLAANTSVWLAHHLPAMMSQAGAGAGIGVGDNAGGISIGLIPVRVGLMNQFAATVSQDLEVIDIRDDLPANLPWPQFGVTVGVGVGFGIEIGADFQFIPDIDVTVADSVSIKVGMLAANGALRWRVNEASGALPAFSIGLSGGYYRGNLDLGADYGNTYTYSADSPIGPVDLEGHYSFSGAPTIDWELFHVAPEVKIAWDIAGIFRPYIGFGFGLNFGSVTGGATMQGEAAVDSVAGYTITKEPQFWQKAETIVTTEPAKYTLRPFLGFDIALAFFAITLQIEGAIMDSEPGTVDLADTAGDFDATSSGGVLGGESSGTAAALVGTLAVRFQF